MRRAPWSSGRVSSTQTWPTLPAAPGGLDDAERRAVARGGQRAGVAVGEHPRSARRKRGAVLADPAVDPTSSACSSRAQSRSAAAAPPAPAGVRLEDLPPRSSAQRRLTAVGRVLPSSAETSSKRVRERRPDRAPSAAPAPGRRPPRRRSPARRARPGGGWRPPPARASRSRSRPPRRAAGSGRGAGARGPPSAWGRTTRGRRRRGRSWGSVLFEVGPYPCSRAPDRMLRRHRPNLKRRLYSFQHYFANRGSAVKGDPRKLGFSTRAIHAGQKPDPRTGCGDGADLSDVHLRAGAAGRGGRV